MNGHGRSHACLAHVLVRIPSRELAADPPPAPVPGEPGERAALSARIRELLADPVLREAVSISSQSLIHFCEETLSGARSPKLKELRRAFEATCRYRIRMSTRPTPFGLFAGVALGRIGDRADARLGTAHRTLSRPDAGWLSSLLGLLESRPEAICRLILNTNDACVVRGDRLELLAPASSTKRAGRFTLDPVTTRALARAGTPVGGGDLQTWLCEVTGLPAAEVLAVLAELVRHGFLLTDLRPPVGHPDPLGYVIDRLARLNVPELTLLRQIRHDLQRYDRLPLGGGGRVLAQAKETINRLQVTDHPIQVDLQADLDVTFPRSVADEIELAATVLWRTSPGTRGSRQLRLYHRQFLERYDVDQPVPLLDLLDPVRGLGPPDGYVFPAHERRPSSEGWASAASEDPAEWETEANGARAELLAMALAEGREEILLDPDALGALEWPKRDRDLVPSAELYVAVLAPSLDALSAGHFRLALSPHPGSRVVGASFGRFAHLLPPATLESLAGRANWRGALPANLVYRPQDPRHFNVTWVPQVLPHTIMVGAVGAVGGERIPLTDLAVTATKQRFILISTALGREIVPVVHHMLKSRNAPNVARFLQEIGDSSADLQPWSWGPWESMPFLPRVRVSRTILRRARWRLGRDVVRAVAEPSWQAALEQWRERWKVPRNVLLLSATDAVDVYIELDLDEQRDRLLLRRECSRRDVIFLEEAAPHPDGWLRGPAGVHRCEAVFPLVPAASPARPSRTQISPVPSRGMAPDLPGGRWLYLKLGLPARQHDDFLVESLAPQLNDFLAAGECDRWFYIRYRDPNPHLRLRFHGPAEHLWGRLLFRLRDWAEPLVDEGRLATMTIDSYTPEVHRYGGIDAMGAAELVFGADSDACLSCLSVLVRADGPPRLPVITAAAGLVHLFREFTLSSDLMDELRDEVGSTGVPKDCFPFAELIDLYSDPGAAVAALGIDADPASLMEPFLARARRLRQYDRRVRLLLASGGLTVQPRSIVRSLAHMHCNRLLGIDPAGEETAMRLAIHHVRTTSL